ncbi:hypothetical protein Q4E93_05295 [Flavitalea sp. BT771]|uniref:hypothetical protein n=1 Tax=Flavitalea sp. BT771 TaxID=3063329 RepID=UPI0026E3D0A8|nr:hypothetical protein [Flavitalea sp. BT771]MDO6429987.1 hypothetical protein [Flavitalea sp. BT771]MDV6217885.1 hypothetical protein [Flavitalea sp. BT771]
MKKEDVPQDLSSLGKITTEICYATDEAGKYTTQPSRGWDVKIGALDVTWENVEKRVKEAQERMAKGEVSPLLYLMEKNVMDIAILADYTGFWKWRVRGHLKPGVFSRLSDKVLQKYAEVFNSTVEELKSMNVHA